MKRLCILSLLALALSLPGFAQAACPAPTPGSPHVCLGWQPVTTNTNGGAITGVTYNVFRATTTKTENYAAPLNPTPVTGTLFYDTTVAVGTTYFYTFTAMSGGATSTPSQEVSAQIPVPPNSPPTPTATID